MNGKTVLLGGNSGLGFACALVAAAGGCVMAGAARAETAFGLVNGPGAQQLITFNTTTRTVLSSVTLDGPLSSIDVRPATGELFGYDRAARQVFRVNPVTGARTAVGTALPIGAITGGAIDFNPVSDRIRLVGDENGSASTGASFRINPVTGERIQDTSLSFATGDANAGKRADVIANAYTNSFAGATTTTLFNLERDLGALLTQVPPNDGTLRTTGNTGLSFQGAFAGFDISGATGLAYVSVATPGILGSPASPSRLFTLNLQTGATTPLGTLSGLPTGRVLQDFAIVPSPGAAAMLSAVGLLALRRRR